MELLCPNCQQKLNIPEQYAGQLMRCPLCNGMFQAPSPGGAPPPPPPQFPPMTNEPFYSGAAPPPAPASESPPLPPGELTKCCTLTISPRVVPWITMLALLFAFILTFLPWISMSLSTTGTIRATGLNLSFGERSNTVFMLSWIFMVIALVLEIPSFLWGASLVPMPDALKAMGPWRPFSIGCIAFVSLALLGIKYIEPLFSAGFSPWSLWAKIAVRLYFVAVIGFVLEIWLESRRLKNLPPPQIQFHR